MDLVVKGSLTPEQFSETQGDLFSFLGLDLSSGQDLVKQCQDCGSTIMEAPESLQLKKKQFDSALG